jgi:hypothetical protein
LNRGGRTRREIKVPAAITKNVYVKSCNTNPIAVPNIYRSINIVELVSSWPHSHRRSRSHAKSAAGRITHTGRQQEVGVQFLSECLSNEVHLLRNEGFKSVQAGSGSKLEGLRFTYAHSVLSSQYRAITSGRNTEHKE